MNEFYQEKKKKQLIRTNRLIYTPLVARCAMTVSLNVR